MMLQLVSGILRTPLLRLGLVLAFLFPTCLAQDWKQQDSGVLTKLQAIFFADKDQGWIVGTNGVVLFTNDGGVKWEKRVVTRGEMFRDIAFLDPGRGFILGEYSIFNRTSSDYPKDRSFLLSSADSGSSWQPAQLFNEEMRADDLKQYTGQGLTRLVFADDRTGWTCGESGMILVTRNSGRTWVRQPVPVSKLLYDLAALDESTAWAVGGGGMILHTVDGGKNWNEQTSGTNKTLRAVQFLDGKNGWAVGSGGAIVSTTNGGSRWTSQVSGVEENLNAVWFTSRTEGWAAGDRGILLHTTTGGRTWDQVNTPTRVNFSRFFFVSPKLGWLVGMNGTILKYKAD